VNFGYKNKLLILSNTYNNRNLVASKTIGNITTISYNYNGNGKVSQVIDGENKVYSYNYDGFDRLKEIIDPTGNKVSYGFDKNSNLTALQGIGADGAALTINNEYNAVDELITQRIPMGTGSEIVTQYGYNQSGSLISMTDPNSNNWSIDRTGSGLIKRVTDPIGNYEDNTYDRRGWTKKVRN